MKKRRDHRVPVRLTKAQWRIVYEALYKSTYGHESYSSSVHPSTKRALWDAEQEIAQAGGFIV